MRMAVVADGRWARTEYRVLDTLRRPAELALLECRLETGRTHQIRVHLPLDRPPAGRRPGLRPAATEAPARAPVPARRRAGVRPPGHRRAASTFRSRPRCRPAECWLDDVDLVRRSDERRSQRLTTARATVHRRGPTVRRSTARVKPSRWRRMRSPACVPDREQHALALVVAGAVLVRLAEVAERDRPVDGRQDLATAGSRPVGRAST